MPGSAPVGTGGGGGGGGGPGGARYALQLAGNLEPTNQQKFCVTVGPLLPGDALDGFYLYLTSAGTESNAGGNSLAQLRVWAYACATNPADDVTAAENGRGLLGGINLPFDPLLTDPTAAAPMATFTMSKFIPAFYQADMTGRYIAFVVQEVGSTVGNFFGSVWAKIFRPI